jgi:plasmid maintenance system killer protein
MATIRNVSEFSKLFDMASLRLHPLTGDRQGFYALTLSGRWRLILTVEGDAVIIEEVTNHYGD